MSLLDQNRLIVRLIGVMTDGLETTNHAGEAAVFADWIGLVFSAKRNRERQVRPRMPLVLAIESDVIENHSLRSGCRKGLTQLRKISACKNSRGHAPFVEST